MADVSWIKLSTGFFDDQKIEMIEGENEECKDMLIVMWVKLMVQAGKDNNGGVFALGNGKPYTIKNFSSIFHRPESDIEHAFGIFQEYGMLEFDEESNTYYLPKWERYQSMDAYERKKARDREYQARRRAAQKEALEDKTEEIPAEEIKAPKKAKNEAEKDDPKTAEAAKEIIDYLNAKAGTKYKANGRETKRLIHARMSKPECFTIDDFKTVIDNKCASWLGDPKMDQYLRPATLFGTKFENYLNEKHTTPFKGNTGLAAGEENDLDGIF